MVYIPSDYVPATVPEDEKYEGTDLDPNVIAGNKVVLLSERAILT